jgi:hypothetical protein
MSEETTEDLAIVTHNLFAETARKGYRQDGRGIVMVNMGETTSISYIPLRNINGLTYEEQRYLATAIERARTYRATREMVLLLFTPPTEGQRNGRLSVLPLRRKAATS